MTRPSVRRLVAGPQPGHLQLPVVRQRGIARAAQAARRQRADQPRAARRVRRRLGGAGRGDAPVGALPRPPRTGHRRSQRRAALATALHARRRPGACDRPTRQSSLQRAVGRGVPHTAARSRRHRHPQRRASRHVAAAHRGRSHPVRHAVHSGIDQRACAEPALLLGGRTAPQRRTARHAGPPVGTPIPSRPRPAPRCPVGVAWRVQRARRVPTARGARHGAPTPDHPSGVRAGALRPLHLRVALGVRGRSVPVTPDARGDRTRPGTRCRGGSDRVGHTARRTGAAEPREPGRDDRQRRRRDRPPPPRGRPPARGRPLATAMGVRAATWPHRSSLQPVLVAR